MRFILRKDCVSFDEGEHTYSVKAGSDAGYGRNFALPGDEKEQKIKKPQKTIAKVRQQLINWQIKITAKLIRKIFRDRVALTFFLLFCGSKCFSDSSRRSIFDVLGKST